MLLEFTKMNGAGNDFILADNRAGTISLTPEQVVRLCDRHRGIGADGLMLLIPSTSGKADWAWTFYNSDGSKADMCGNGARCFARYIQRTTGTDKKEITFDTAAGIIHAAYHGDRVTLGLTSPHGLRLNEAVNLTSGCVTIHTINTGVPHSCVFVDDADKVMVSSVGPEIRYHEHFAPKGTNANFIQKLGDQLLAIRTYERGVEDETLACGTGVVASALIYHELTGTASPIGVKVRGGDILEVAFAKRPDGYSEVTLTGPADFVFEGTVAI